MSNMNMVIEALIPLLESKFKDYNPKGKSSSLISTEEKVANNLYNTVKSSMPNETELILFTAINKGTHIIDGLSFVTKNNIVIKGRNHYSGEKYDEILKRIVTTSGVQSLFKMKQPGALLKRIDTITLQIHLPTNEYNVHYKYN